MFKQALAVNSNLIWRELFVCALDLTDSVYVNKMFEHQRRNSEGQSEVRIAFSSLMLGCELLPDKLQTQKIHCAQINHF